MTPESSTPGPERPTDPRDELVQALLGLRWALPRTDADARVALDQLSAVTDRLAMLAAPAPGEPESPWEGQVQTLLAQAGFALDWWRPVLDDVDLDWTLNHQAHLSADLARIASAGARILDRYAPTVAHPHEAEGPFTLPPAGNRVLAAFGSVPATAIIDPLANSGRHRRPAYEFDAPIAHHTPAAPPPPPVPPAPAPMPVIPPPEQISPSALPGSQPLLYPQIVEFAAQPLPAAPPAEPVTQNPDAAFIANLLAPPPPIPVQQPVEDLLGPSEPALPVPVRPRPPASAAAPPNAFTPPIIWGAAEPAAFDDEDDDPIVRDARRRTATGSTVLQAVGILGVVGALCWWAVTSLHPDSGTSHPAAGSITRPTTAASGAAKKSAAPAGGAATSPAAAPSSPATQPSHAAPVGGAAKVTALQVSLLGGSTSQQQVAMVLSVNTSGTGPVTVSVDYYGMKNGAKFDERAASWPLSGKTTYQIGATIPTGDYCGTVFTLTATGGDATATQTTAPC
ncbi:MAG TPA: hypothetical protein VFU73_04025 [Actinocrinis sp.]|nr:hypothetical protein [Actinocrinis sp.]